jgi:hypothetical protein
MKRKELQALCKKNNISAKLTNLEMANKLTSLIKGTGKPKAPGPSSLKNSIDVVVVEDSDVESKPSKKVKFTPQNELFEFTNSNPRETRRMTRRNSMFLNNPVRVTRTRAQNLLGDGLVLSMNHPVEKEKGSKSKEVITKIDEPKLPTRRLSRKREVEQNDAVSTQNHAEAEERFECDEEIVNKVVRTTRSRTQGAVNDGFVSITSPPVKKKKGSKSRNAVAEIDEVKLPTKRLLRNRKVDQNDADSIQDQVEDAERFKPSEEIVNNPVRVTRSRTERSVDEGLASTMNPPVKMKRGRKSIVEITKIDVVKLPSRRLLRNREVVQNDAVSTQNQAEAEERVECDEEIVNKVVRTTRSRAQGAVNAGFVSIINPPVEKKKGSKSRNAVAAIDEVISPTKRLSRNRKVDQNDAVLNQDQVEDAERLPIEEIVNNPVRVTRSRTENSVDDCLASTMNPPVKMKSGRKSIVEITKIDEVKLPTRRLLRNREVVQNDAVTTQNHAEDEERFECDEEIVNKVVRTTRSRAQGAVNDGFVSIINPPVEKKKGSKSRNAVVAIDEVISPTKRLLRNRKVDQKDADSIQDQVEDAERFEPSEVIVNNPVRFTRSRTERFEPNEKIVNNPVRVTRSRTESSVDEGLASTMSPPVKMKSGRKSNVEITKIDEAKSPTRRLLRNREVKESSIDSIQSHIAKRGRKRTLDNLQEPQCVTVLSDDICDNKEKQSASVSEGNGRKRQTSGRDNRRKTVVSQLADEEKVENSKADVVDSSDVFTSSQSPNLENPDSAEEQLYEILVQDYATKEVEDGSTVIEEGLNDKDYQETVIAKESQDENEKDACVLTSAEDFMEETFIENEQESELHLSFGSPVVRSNPCEAKESSSDEKLVEVAISLNKENEGLKEIEQDISLHDTVGVNDDEVEVSVQGTLSCKVTHLQDDVIQNFSNTEDSVDCEKLDVVEVATSDNILKLANHEGAFDSSIETGMCDTTEGEHEKLQGENDDNRESPEDTATEEHAEKPHFLMEELVAETYSLHDNVVLEHPVSVSDDYGISSDLHSSLNVANEIDQVSEFQEEETEEMKSKYENEHTTNVACAATSEENSSEGCAELKQGDKLYSNNNALQRPTDEEDNGDCSNEGWHEEELKILFATPVVENRTVRETGNVSFGNWDKTQEKINGEETFNPRSNDGWHGSTEAAQDEPTNSSLHPEQEMANQDTEDSNAVKNNDIEQQISETMETSLKIVEKVEFIEENKKGVEDSTLCYKDLDNVAGEDILIARPEANNEMGSFEPDENKDILNKLPVAEGVYDSQSIGSCIHEQGEAMVKVVAGKLNEFQELVQNSDDFNAFTGSVIRKFVEQVEVVEVDKSNARQSETENVDESQSSVVKVNGTKSIADFCFEDEELNNMFATPMVNQEIKTYNVVKSNNIEVRIREEIMESAFRSVERVEVIDKNKKKAIVEESTSEVDLDMVIEKVSKEANTEVDISKEPKLEDSLFVDECSDVQERVYEFKTADLSVTGHAEEEAMSDVLEDNKGIGECGDLHTCESQISVITLDTAEPAEVTTENPETEIESEIEETVSVAEGAENSVVIADESNVFIHVAVQDEQHTPVDSSFFHDQETVNRDTNEILQSCDEFDAYTDWAATTFAEHMQVDEFEETNAKEAEIDCETEQPPSVADVAFDSEATANVSDGFFDLAVEDEQLLPVDSSFFHGQETVNQEIDNKMIKDNSNDILQHCDGFGAFTGSASNAQESEIESGHERAPVDAKGAENSVAISDESNEFFHIAFDDNSSSLHDKEMVNQEIDDKMSEEFTNSTPKSVQEVLDFEESKRCIVDEFIFEDCIIYNQDPLKVLDEDTENLNLEANDVANMTNNELGFSELFNTEKTKPGDEIEIPVKLLTDSFENQVGETVSEVLKDKVCNNVEEDQQTWEDKDWSEGNNVEEDQQTWEEKDWSEVNIFDDIQEDFDGTANAARDTRESSSDAADVLSEDEVNKFDEVRSKKSQITNQFVFKTRRQ